MAKECDECDKKCDSHEGYVLDMASLKAKVYTGGFIASVLVGSLIAFVASVSTSQQSLAKEAAEEFKVVRQENSATSSDVRLINNNIENLTKALMYNRRILISIAEQSKVELPSTTSLLILNEDE